MIDEELKDIKKIYLSTFACMEGETVLADLQSAYYRRSSFSKDPYETAYREGQRSVIIRILNLLEEDKENG